FVSSVALHVLDRLSDPALLATVRENGAWPRRELEEVERRTRPDRAMRGIGYMWGIDIMGSASHVVEAARELGLLTCTAGECTVRLLPPLVATRDELARGIDVREQVL